jgi:L-lactate dehydrogenase complex protein LldF
VATRETEFSLRVHDAVNNERLRRSFREAMDDLIRKRLDQFHDDEALQTLRNKGAAIRANALAKLPDLLEQLERRCESNGIRVHWAESVDQANQIILRVIRDHDGQRVIKGKSMVTEEMGLNEFLEDWDIEVLESDLGEYILQLLGERPSHIVMPAIHKTKAQIADLFAHKFPDIPYTEDVDQLTATARKVLRKAFFESSIGISGVNFAVAETGTLCLVENEGNGRMCTTMPDVHIAVTGIEKVVENLADVPPLLSLLTRSATGQPITTYFNMISSPRKPGEKDGPREVHLVLLDNGRSDIHASTEFQDTLRCIRCGACINHCPVYTRIGGHSYGTVYPGPIGTIFEPQKAGLQDHGELLTASPLCNACTEVCPVCIPITSLINRLRYQHVNRTDQFPDAGKGRKFREMLIWKLWSAVNARPGLYRWGIEKLMKYRHRLPRQLQPWTEVRTLPEVAEKSLHQMAREKGIRSE